MRQLLAVLFVFISFHLKGQSDFSTDQGILQRLYDTTFVKSSNPYSSKQWENRIRINGYLQFRMNFESNPDMLCEQCDASYGSGGRFIIRRMRLKASGFVHPKVYFYFQADFASDGINLGQLRDAYGDVFMDKNNTFWMRFGQSKIMYGFDNMQSSQNRVPLDRSDPINSAIKNERDLMLSFYYTPQKRKKIFKELILKGLKGSGNYGMLAFGLYNGQTANTDVTDDDGHVHSVVHFAYPFTTGNGKYAEFGLHAYGGLYQTNKVSDSTIAYGRFDEQGDPIYARGQFWNDARLAATLIAYPQPIGFQMEYNIGTGPEYQTDSRSIDNQFLHGGYVSLIGNIMLGKHKFYPFTRLQYYQGGKKFELDARSIDMYEFELGTEWSPFYPFELQVTYAYAQRNYSDGARPLNHQNGHLVRFQFQINY